MSAYGRTLSFTCALLATLGVSTAASAQQLPAAVAAPGYSAVLSAHAEGAQLYDCVKAADGKLAWKFREPIASLLVDGKTVGRHYAGPKWESVDGSIVVAKAVGNAVNETVVFTFMVLFAINVIVTAVGIQFTVG